MPTLMVTTTMATTTTMAVTTIKGGASISSSSSRPCNTESMHGIPSTLAINVGHDGDGHDERHDVDAHDDDGHNGGHDDEGGITIGALTDNFDMATAYFWQGTLSHHNHILSPTLSYDTLS